MSGASSAWITSILADTSIDTVVCCGSGGVGKTTTAAALAVYAAEQGRHVVVLTIDPARRLAQALGLSELDNTPRLVEGTDTGKGGSLSAMMLDMKRTFDEVVQAHTSEEKAEAILANPFYQSISTSFAGTSEYMAMEKLSQLRSVSSVPGGNGSKPWDLLIVDTPPSRSALDFLDAPERLSSFLDGRFIRLLTAPARAGNRVGRKAFGQVASSMASVMSKVLGSQVLADVQTFVAAMDSMFGGFRERAEATYSMLASEHARFVVVATPEEDALQEAEFFVERLAADKMPLGGAVMNRVVPPLAGVTSDEAWQCAARDDVSSLTRGLLELYAAQRATRDAEQALVSAFAVKHQGVQVACVPAHARDVTDIPALREVASSAVSFERSASHVA